MSIKVGEISPFPPLPGQPYPPARNHPRWKELYRLHDEWIMKYWPFTSEQKRARIPFMNLAGFSTWCTPAANFDRMVWESRVLGLFFLSDDYLDSGKMFDRVPGFKKAATGTGPLHLDDRAELCHDIGFRAIQASAHPRTFDQITRSVLEFWDSQIHEPYLNLEEFFATRRVDIGLFLTIAIARYTLDINLTDEQANHPLMREAEGIVCDHCALVNDYFSYAKENLSNSDDNNLVRLLQDRDGITYEQAMKIVEGYILQKERDFIPAGMAVLNHPDLGKDPEVRRAIAALPYFMGGNLAWSQETGRYNIGNVPGAVPFPKMSFAAEPTPEADIVDDTEESRLRDLKLNVEHVPAPEFIRESNPIESSTQKSATKSSLVMSNLVRLPQRHRPENVGIAAIEISPRTSTSEGNLTNGALEIVSSDVTSAVSSLLSRYSIEPTMIGRVDVSLTCASAKNSETIIGSIVNMMRSSGNVDIEGITFTNSAYASVRSLVSAVSWIESSSWDGRYALIIAGDDETNVTLLISANAPVVLEPYQGFSLKLGDSSTPTALVSTALHESFSVYQRKRDAWFSRSGFSVPSETDPATTFFAFDYMIYDGAHEDVLREAHVELYEKSYQALKMKDICLASKDIDSGVNVTAPKMQHKQQMSPLKRLALLIHAVPGYNLFEKRIALFAYRSGEGSSYLSFRVMGDTQFIRDSITHKMEGSPKRHTENHDPERERKVKKKKYAPRT